MHGLTKVILTSGLIPKESLAEFQRWGFLPTGTIPDLPKPETPDQLIQNIERALQEEELVVVRETDLESLNRYLTTMKQGSLHVVTPDSVGDFPVMYGQTELGEYIIPWSSDGIEEVMTNGETYLQYDQGPAKARVYFSSMRELFYGDVKAFIVCKGSRWELINERSQSSDSSSE